MMGEFPLRSDGLARHEGGERCILPVCLALRVRGRLRSLSSLMSLSYPSRMSDVRETWGRREIYPSCVPCSESERQAEESLLRHVSLISLSYEWCERDMREQRDISCVESYVLMCPFYYSNYQSILFCVESVIKFLSHNDVCVCLSIVLYLLIPHSYKPIGKEFSRQLCVESYVSIPSFIFIKLILIISTFSYDFLN